MSTNDGAERNRVMVFGRSGETSLLRYHYVHFTFGDTVCDYNCHESGVTPCGSRQFCQSIFIFKSHDWSRVMSYEDVQAFKELGIRLWTYFPRVLEAYRVYDEGD